VLEAWLDVFSDRYLKARQSVPPDPDDDLHRRLAALRGVTAAPRSPPCR
jgi:DTW domain-containing protein